QVIINRTDRLLERWGLSKETMSREEYGRWLLHVITLPADADETAPAFEAFFRPAEPVDLHNPTQKDLWQESANLVRAALNGETINPDPGITSAVQFYCSVRKNSPLPPISFALRIPEPGAEKENTSLTYTYFFTTFPQSVAAWCQDNSP
ncbi:hypothetical protein D6833_06320, partial [Candidatus Parcubacteria bacterium]